MNANEIMPSCAIENATSVDLAIMKVAAAVPGPQTTRAAVPTNSAANRLEKVTSAIRSAHNPRVDGGPRNFKAGRRAGGAGPAKLQSGAPRRRRWSRETSKRGAA